MKPGVPNLDHCCVAKTQANSGLSDGNILKSSFILPDSRNPRCGSGERRISSMVLSKYRNGFPVSLLYTAPSAVTHFVVSAPALVQSLRCTFGEAHQYSHAPCSVGFPFTS